jgi:hypothetical protein
MSLLDDVSIVVTPNGYKAGELYAVIPVPTEGAEEIDNGGFVSVITPWTEVNINTTFSPLLFTNTANNGNIRQNFTTTVGRRYKLSGDILSGAWTIFASTSTSTGGSLGSITVTGDLIFTATTTTTYILCYLVGGTGTEGVIDNISVKEYTSADMDVTRETAATRVDENGLVNYAEVIGGELVDCGNFECAVPLDSWSTGAGWTISGGTANSDGTGGTLQQLSILESGKSYKINCDASGLTNLIAFTGFSNSLSERTIPSGNTTFFLTANSTTLGIFSNGTATIDNISVKEVTRDNVPRIDYTGGGCPHILAEPMRTNLLTYSEDFSNAIWTKNGSSVTPNATTSPDGTINADKLVEDTSTGGHQIQSITSASNSTIYTTSVFVKYAGREWIRFTDAQSSNRIHFNTLTGVFGTISGTVIDYNSTALEDGWYKLSFTTTSVATAYTPRIALAEADNDVSYTGDGVSGVYIWGAQLELGSYPTSYIPTDGGTVTRNQDIFTRDGIGSLIGQTEGTVFVDVDFDTLSGLNMFLSIRPNSSNKIEMYRDGNLIYGDIVSSSSFTFIKTGVTVGRYKIALSYSSGSSAMYINGDLISSNSTSFAFTSTLNDLYVNSRGGTSFIEQSKYYNIQLYKTALTPTQLIALTS